MATPFAVATPRVACPACGAAIHPVASRCRHCRVEVRHAADGPRPAERAAPPRRASLRPRPVFIAALMLVIALAAAVPLATS